MILSAILLVSLPLNPALTAVDVKQNRVVLCIPVADGEEFVIRFVHSVNKRPVFDFLRVEDSHFIVVKSRYDAFGAGMPEAASEGMTFISEKDGMMELADINRRLEDFTVFVGTVAEHSLIVQNREIFLKEFVQPGNPMKFMISKVSYFHLWKGRYIHE